MPKMNISAVLTKEYENIRPRRHGKSKANLTQFNPIFNPIKPNQTQFQKRPKMNVNKALTKDYENIRPRRRAEMLTVQVNLPLIPADKTNWSHPQAQGARKDMPHCRGFLIEKCRNQRPGQAGYTKGSKDG